MSLMLIAIFRPFVPFEKFNIFILLAILYCESVQGDEPLDIYFRPKNQSDFSGRRTTIDTDKKCQTKDSLKNVKMD